MGRSNQFNGVVSDLMRVVSPQEARVIAERTGIEVRTIDALRYGESGRWAENILLPILAALGPSAVNKLIAPLGMGGAHYLNQDQCFRDVHVTVSKLDATLTELGADGIFDHQDRAKLQPLLNEAAPKIAAAAGGRR